jgi:hypothetical protein
MLCAILSRVFQGQELLVSLPTARAGTSISGDHLSSELQDGRSIGRLHTFVVLGKIGIIDTLLEPYFGRFCHIAFRVLGTLDFVAVTAPRVKPPPTPWFQGFVQFANGARHAPVSS